MQKRILSLILCSFLLGMVHAEVLDKVVAIVNDNVIAESELNAQVEAMRNQLVMKKMKVPSDEILRKQVLQHLIDVDIQLQLAKRNNFTIEEADLDAAIKKVADANHLTVDGLREAVKTMGISFETYRENMKKEMLMSRMQEQAVGKEVVVSSQQIEDYLKTAQYSEKDKATYELQNILIPLPEEPTPEQINHAKEKAAGLLKKIKQGSDFGMMAVAESSDEYALEGGSLGERHLAELPEVFSEKVVDMKVGEVAGPIRTGNGFQLIKLVAVKGQDEHHQVLKTHVRHILIKADASTTVEEAKRRVDNIYQQIKAGKDFGLMAKQYSLDAESAIKGGDLGWVTADELVPQFATAMDKLSPHQLSRPIKSPFGWHLIEVLERKSVDDSIAFKRQQVQQFLRQRKFNEAVQNWQQHLRADSYVQILDKALA